MTGKNLRMARSSSGGRSSSARVEVGIELHDDAKSCETIVSWSPSDA
jgi:hypothetical protein